VCARARACIYIFILVFNLMMALKSKITTISFVLTGFIVNLMVKHHKLDE
jgi:hypothetical protein